MPRTRPCTDETLGTPGLSEREKPMRTSTVLFGVVAAAGLAGSAMADVAVVNFSNWYTYGGFGHVDNGSTSVNVPVGSTITSATISMSGTGHGDSVGYDLVLSLNDSSSRAAFWDLHPSNITTTRVSYNGVHTWGTNTVSGFGAVTDGSAFTVNSGVIFITAYDANYGSEDPDNTIYNATITINYTVPAPAAGALMGVGMLIAARRRRA